LPRSPTSVAIGIDQALKDAARERICVNGREVVYSVSVSEKPEVASGELTERLGEVIEEATLDNER